jgi:transposase
MAARRSRSRFLACQSRELKRENGVGNASLWCALLGVEKTVIEDVEAAEAVIAHVRPRRPAKGRCGVCGGRAP